MGKRGITYKFEGVDYDSPEETYLAMWLNELKDKGYIKKWSRDTDSYLLTPPVYNTYTEGKKSKTQSILQDSKYTPDFIVYWEWKARRLFFNILNQDEKIKEPFIANNYVAKLPFSVVEVKPSFDRNNMTRLFRHIQKNLYHYNKIFVTQINIEDLFEKTFTPALYLFTKTGKQRKITKWKVLSLEEFLKKNEQPKGFN